LLLLVSVDGVADAADGVEDAVDAVKDAVDVDSVDGASVEQ
jgi:hypothetical protein